MAFCSGSAATAAAAEVDACCGSCCGVGLAWEWVDEGRQVSLLLLLVVHGSGAADDDAAGGVGMAVESLGEELVADEGAGTRASVRKVFVKSAPVSAMT